MGRRQTNLRRYCDQACIACKPYSAELLSAENGRRCRAGHLGLLSWPSLEEPFGTDSNKHIQRLALSKRHISRLWRQKRFSGSVKLERGRHCAAALVMSSKSGSKLAAQLMRLAMTFPAEHDAIKQR